MNRKEKVEGEMLCSRLLINELSKSKAFEILFECKDDNERNTASLQEAKNP